MLQFEQCKKSHKIWRQLESIDSSEMSAGKYQMNTFYLNMKKSLQCKELIFVLSAKWRALSGSGSWLCKGLQLDWECSYVPDVHLPV